MDQIFLSIQHIGENVDIQHFRIRPMMIKAIFIFKAEVKIIEADRTETNVWIKQSQLQKIPIDISPGWKISL